MVVVIFYLIYVHHTDVFFYNLVTNLQILFIFILMRCFFKADESRFQLNFYLIIDQVEYLCMFIVHIIDEMADCSTYVRRISIIMLKVYCFRFLHL